MAWMTITIWGTIRYRPRTGSNTSQLPRANQFFKMKGPLSVCAVLRMGNQVKGDKVTLKSLCLVFPREPRADFMKFHLILLWKQLCYTSAYHRKNTVFALTLRHPDHLIVWLESQFFIPMRKYILRFRNYEDIYSYNKSNAGLFLRKVFCDIMLTQWLEG